MADSQKFVQAQPFTLYGSGCTVGATSIILTSFTKLDATTITMTDLGTKGYMTLEPGNSIKEEAITFTGVTQNANGTATLTGVSNQMTEAPYTETSGTTKTHVGATIAILTNTAGFYNDLTGKNNDETITGVWTFTDPNVPRMDVDHVYGAGEDKYFATKKYADDLAIAGSPQATAATYGITRLSLDPATPATPIAVGDNDTRVPSQTENDALVGTSGTPSSSNKYVTNDDTSATSPAASKIPRLTSGSKIPSAFLAFGGSGADGALAISSGTTTLDLGNADVFVKNYTSISITGTGKLAFSNPGTNGTIINLKSQGDVTLTSSTVPLIDASALGSAGGTAGAVTATGGSNGVGNSFVIGINSASGGTAGVSSGGTGGPVSSASAAAASNVLLNIYGKRVPVSVGSGGSGGGGGTGDPAYTGGAGGRGGAAVVIECGGAWNFTTTGGITVAGAAGSASPATPATNYHFSGGGGGGGAGGMFLAMYTSLTANTGTVTVTGGNGGASGAGGTNGGSGNLNAGGGGAGGTNLKYAGGNGGNGGWTNGGGASGGANGTAGTGTGAGTGGIASVTGVAGGGGGGGAAGFALVTLNTEF